MTPRHPLSDRCSARAKATGQRCQRRVVGGGVCYLHGGRSPNARAAREARVLVGLARLEGERSGDPSAAVELRDPGQILLEAARDADATLQWLKAKITETGGRLDPVALSVLGDWIDRAQRVSKTVLDAKLDERAARMGKRQVGLAESQGALLALAIRTIFDRLVLTDDQESRVPVVVPTVLRELASGELR